MNCFDFPKKKFFSIKDLNHFSSLISLILAHSHTYFFSLSPLYSSASLSYSLFLSLSLSFPFSILFPFFSLCLSLSTYLCINVELICMFQVEHIEQMTREEPYLRIGWANSVGFKPFPGSGDRFLTLRKRNSYSNLVESFEKLGIKT